MYSPSGEDSLRNLIRENPDLDLFAACGVDCENWEDAVDGVCVLMDVSGESPGAFCNTTSHPGQDADEVSDFAEEWCDRRGWKRDVRIVDV
jgi:hypothetical protein